VTERPISAVLARRYVNPRRPRCLFEMDSVAAEPDHAGGALQLAAPQITSRSECSITGGYGAMSKPRSRRVYSAAEHERLLQHHQACWDRMRAIGQELGRDSHEYENALQAVIAARWAIGVETRKRRPTAR
jgi:hypothetical protein